MSKCFETFPWWQGTWILWYRGTKHDTDILSVTCTCTQELNALAVERWANLWASASKSWIMHVKVERDLDSVTRKANTKFTILSLPRLKLISSIPRFIKLPISSSYRLCAVSMLPVSKISEITAQKSFGAVTTTAYNWGFNYNCHGCHQQRGSIA